MLLYELTTGGSVPYASFCNTEVKAKVGVWRCGGVGVWG